MVPSLLRLSPEDPSRVIQTADRLERSSQRAIATVDSLLAFSRASRVEPRESGAVGQAVRNALEEVEPLVAHLGASIEVAEGPDLVVACSPGLLQIVLANLVGNAVKYLEGRVERHVRLEARQDGSWCRIDVEDTGPGIPREAQAKIFEPFFRVAGVRASGTGIGLATVRRILEARGGRIAVESTEGRGSRFTVWLPLAPPQPTDDEAKSARRLSVH
jgi:signal transduction histidine kinase